MIFPAFHVLADLARWTDGYRLVACRSNDPLAVEGLALWREAEGIGGRSSSAGPRPRRAFALLAANLGPTARTVRIGPLSGAAGAAARVRSLDAITAPIAMFEPERFRASWSTLAPGPGGLVLTLRPYGVACIEVDGLRS